MYEWLLVSSSRQVLVPNHGNDNDFDFHKNTKLIYMVADQESV